MDLLKVVADFVWGPPLIIFLIGVGLWLTIRLKFIQLRFLVYGFQIMTGRHEEDAAKKEAKGDISSFQALATALSATIGTGNIVGVAGAILIGGLVPFLDVAIGGVWYGYKIRRSLACR